MPWDNFDPETDHLSVDELREHYGGEIPECDSCGELLATNGGCLTCLFSYESACRTAALEDNDGTER